MRFFALPASEILNAAQPELHLTLPALAANNPIFLGVHADSLGSVPVVPVAMDSRGLLHETGALGYFSAGSFFTLSGSAAPHEPFAVVLGHTDIPADGYPHTNPCVQLRLLQAFPGGEVSLLRHKKASALAWVTLSDKGSKGLREDGSGPLMETMVAASMQLSCASGHIIPDDIPRLRALVLQLALRDGYDLILTSGGTGLSPRDTTPEALLPLLDRRLHGFEQAMMLKSLSVTPKGALSRAVAGSIGSSILITLPGSSKAVKENLDAVLPALRHALDKLQGDTGDCGS